MPDAESSMEGTIEEFLELESELSSSETGVTGTYEEGTIAGVSKIPVGDAPDGYPVPIDTSYALHVDVETEGGTVTIFLEWPDDGETSDHVDRLLNALHRDPGEFADIYGDRVALEAEDGWHGIDVDRTATFHGAAEARDDESVQHSKYLVMASVAVGTLPFIVAPNSVGAVGRTFQMIAWIAIPVSLYLDMQNVREYLDWDTNTTLWLIGGAIPSFNAVVGFAYLLDRHVQTRGVEGRTTADIWYKTIVASLLLPIPAAVIGPFHNGLGVLFVLCSVLLLPMSIYFDAEYVEEVADWDPNEELWAIGTVLATGMLLWWVVGLAYLLKRHSELD